MSRILNITSIWSKIAKEIRIPYATSTFRLDGMTIALAAEVSNERILCNCLAPGFIDTELTRKNIHLSEIVELAQQVPIGRLGQPNEITEFTAWFVEMTHTYVTAQNFSADGGFTRV